MQDPEAGQAALPLSPSPSFSARPICRTVGGSHCELLLSSICCQTCKVAITLGKPLVIVAQLIHCYLDFFDDHLYHISGSLFDCCVVGLPLRIL